MKKFQSKNGFTMIELLVVIAIIGVLVTIVIVAINPARLVGDASDSKRRSDLNQIKASMQLYYNDCKKYPPAGSLDFAGQEAFDDEDGTDACDNNNTYMKQLPLVTGANYTYTTDGTRANYEVTARLNNSNSDDAATLSKCASTIAGGYSDGSANFVVCND